MANDRKIGISLEFNANTNQAKAALQDLQNSLSRLTNDITTGKADLPITKSITQAISETSKLQAILQSSTTSIGTLDLGQFRNELSKAGMSAQTVSNTLSSLGPEGIKAFGQLTQSVITAEVPLKRTNTLLTNFAITLKNAAKWQISSSILHGFIGSIQKAYGYAEDLNKSLNNIRIVTGQSTQQMTDFAKQANKAAKELSTTTTAYTDAALIFYQQGLTGDAVKDRTDTVIKMSNVTGQSAEEVSSYMTAIWNNFDDGSKSLEHYADVITALGASTASSSEEIAEGLEKFAAIGDTVGLSYEYATTALATVVAQTRQSADTVGTAFKTLFARIQDLELGKTLDDGTTLGKYSQALAAIGVNIKDASGQVKDMDQILDEMGSKWKTVSKDTQIAVAQAVAGTRQYSQLVALMDNWGEFQKNLNVANNSDGALQKQADIYAESWEAARDRVRASMETIYSSLLDDEFFIKLTNGFADLLGGIKEVIDRFGGLKNIVPLVGAALMNAFGPTLAKNIDNFAYNLQNTESKALQFKETFLSSFSNFDDNSIGFQVMKDSATDLAEAMSAIIQRQETLNKLGLEYSDVEKMSHNYIIENIKKLNEKREQQAEILKLAREEAEQTKKVLVNDISNNFKRFIAEGSKAGGRGKAYASEATKKRAENRAIKQQNNLQTQLEEETSKPEIEQDKEKIIKLNAELDKCKQKIKEIQETPITIKISEEAKANIEGNLTKLDEMSLTIGSARTALESYNLSEKEGTEAAAQLVTNLEGLQSGFEKSTEANEIFNQALDDIRNNNAAEGMKKVEKALEILEQESLKVSDELLEQIESLGLTEEQYKGLSHILEQYKIKLEAVGKAETDLGKTNKEVKDIVDRLVKSIEEANSKVQNSAMSIGSFISTSAGAVMNFASVLNSVNSLIDQLSDPDLSGWQKFTAVLTSGSMAVMMLSNGIGSAIKIYSSFTPTMNAAKMALMGLNTEEELSNFLKAQNVQVTEQETLAQLKQKAATELQNKSLLKLIATKIKHIATTIIEKIVTGDLKTIILTGLVVAFTALISIMAVHAAKLKAATEEAKKLADTQTKLREQEEEEIKTVRELTTAYNELNKQYQNHELSLSELKNKTYLLCLQYGEQELAVKALSASYQDLQNIMKDTEINAAKKIADSTELEKEYYKKVGIRTVQQERGSSNDSLQLTYINSARKDEIDFKNQLQALYESQGHQGSLFTGNEIKIDDLLTLMFDNEEEFNKILLKSDSESAAILLEYSEKLGEIRDSYQEAANIYNENQKIVIANENSKNIKKLQDYQLAINKMTKEALEDNIFNGKDAEKKARAWAQSALLAIDSTFSTYSKKSSLIDNILEDTGLLTKQRSISKVNDENFEEVYLQTMDQNYQTYDFVLDKYLKDKERHSAEDIYNGQQRVLQDLLETALNVDGQLDFDENGKFFYAEQIKDALEEKDYESIDLENLLDIIKQAKLSGGIITDTSKENVANSAIENYLADADLGTLQFFANNKNILTEGIAKAFEEDKNADIGKVIEDITKQFAPSIEFYGAEAGKEYINSLMDSMVSSSSKLDKSQVDELYKNLKELGLGIDIDKGNFNDLDYESQLGALLEASVKINDFNANNKDAYIAAKQANRDNFKYSEEIDTQEKRDTIADYKNIYDYSNRAVDITKAAQNGTIDEDQRVALANGNWDELSEELAKVDGNYEKLEGSARDYFFGLVAISGETEDTIAKQLTQTKLLNDETNAYNQLEIELENAKNGLIDYNTVLKTSEKFGEISNNSLENLQKSYNSLSSIVKSYNTTGHFTLDNLQSLIELGPQYIQYLHKTADGYAIDKASLVELTKARLTDLAYAKYQEAQSALNIYAQGKEAEGYAEAKEKILAVAGSHLINASAMKIETAQYGNLTSEMKNYAAAMQTEIDALLSVRDNLTTDNIDQFLGSGSGSSKTKKILDDEFDRYYAIKEAIEDIEDAMSDLQKMQKHVHGKALIQALEKQNQLLDQQKAKYEELYEVQKVHAGDYQATLAQYGAQFSETGDITNYAEITKAMVDKYNSNLGNEKTEKDYEFFKKMMDEYLSLLDEMEDNLNKIDDIYYEQLSNNLTKWETDIQINLDLKSAEREWQEFLDEINKDFMSVNEDIGATMSSIVTRSVTYSGDNGTIAIDTKAMQDIMREIDIMQAGGQSSMFASISEAQESLKEYLNTFQDDAKALYQLVQDAWDAYNEGCDQAINNFNDLLDEYEKINNSLEHQGNMIELIYGENAYDYLSQLYDAQVKNIEGQIDSLKIQIGFYKNQYEQAVNEYGADSEVAQKWKEAWENAVDELYEKEENHIKNLLEVYKNTVNKEFDDLDKRLTGGVGTDWALEQWDLEKKAAEGYYDSVEKVYQIETMESKWEAALSKAGTLKSQQKLKDVMAEQMKILEKKSELTEYDIELAERRLAVTQAEIALEEAQNNKNSMKLTRGADGNWSYQYVVDEDEVAKKQQELNDAQYNAYEYTKKSLEEITRQTLEDMKAWEEAVKSIQIQMATASEDERAVLQQRLDWYNEYYGKKLNKDIDERGQHQKDVQIEATALLLAEYNTDEANYERMTEAEKKLIDDAVNYGITKASDLYKDTNQAYENIRESAEVCCSDSIGYWNSAASEIIDKWAEDPDSVKNEILDTLAICKNEQENYTSIVIELYGDIEKQIQENINKTNELAGSTQDLASSTAKSLNDYKNNLNAVIEQWENMRSGILDAADAARQYLQILSDLIAKQSQVSNITPGDAIGNPNNGDDNVYTDKTSPYQVAANGTSGNGMNLYNLYKNGQSISLKTSGNAITAVLRKEGLSDNDIKKILSNGTGIKMKDFGFDTGGYTGEWNGDSGRLAMLHSKELVLNQEDTKNILSAVSIIRNISNIGNSIANGMHNMMASLLGLKPSEFVGTTNTNNENTDNTFNITMNVDGGNIEEIKNAILNLPNLASQYLSKNKK